jgi:hypothetical protein
MLSKPVNDICEAWHPDSVAPFRADDHSNRSAGLKARRLACRVPSELGAATK